MPGSQAFPTHYASNSYTSTDIKTDLGIQKRTDEREGGMPPILKAESLGQRWLFKWFWLLYPQKDEHSLEDYSVYFAGVYSQLILRFHVELPGCMFKLMLLQRGDWCGGKNVSFMTLPESNKFRPCKCKSTIFRLLFSIKSTIVLGTLLWSLWLPSSFRWKIQFQRFENHRLLRTLSWTLKQNLGAIQIQRAPSTGQPDVTGFSQETEMLVW